MLTFSTFSGVEKVGFSNIFNFLKVEKVDFFNLEKVENVGNPTFST